jgi:hypothetical protein
VSTNVHFDPQGALARADQTLAEVSGQLAPELVDIDTLKKCRDRLQQCNAELKFNTVVCKEKIPGWGEFAWKFAAGFGGIAFLPVTFGWSAFVTMVSAGAAIHDAYKLFETRELMEQIEDRTLAINRALRRIDALSGDV